MAWSFSALSGYETCPRRHWETRIAKRVQDPPGEEAQWGTRLHKVLEDRLKSGQPITGNLSCYEPYAAKVESLKAPTGTLYAERKIALTRDLEPTTYFAKNVWVRAVLDVSVDNGPKLLIFDWKGFPLDTEIPTPNGFVKMEDMAVGSEAFAGDGSICKVIGVSAIHQKRCLAITFDDNTSITCDADHLWQLSDSSIVRATELRLWDRIRMCSPAQYREQNLPIDPYVFGLWVADGKHTSGEISKPDAFIWDEIQRRGYVLSENYDKVGSKCRVHTIKGIRGHLRELGVLGDKHIPECYLRGSVRQRVDLLRGLMDGDGNANPARKQAVFTTTDKGISDSVKELLESLGQRVNQATTTQRGFGLAVTAYPLSFRPQLLNPFLLPRKADRVLPKWGVGNSWRRQITNITEVPAEATMCIGVDSIDNTYLCGRNYLRTHNSGKQKPSEQLELSAAIGAAVHPQAQVIQTAFIWLKPKTTDIAVVKRPDVGAIWSRFLPRVARMEEAQADGSYEAFPPKPSGLCRKWCPVKSCEFHGV